MKKTLVIGSKSFIGKACLTHYRKYFPSLKHTHYQHYQDAYLCNLLHPSLEALNLKKDQYEYGLIAASISDISECEKKPKATSQCNVTGSLALAQILIDLNITPILFSSDYVFDGIRGYYSENSIHHPVNEYGRQKSELEQRLPQICGDNYLLLRLSKIFGTLLGDNTLLDEMGSQITQNKVIQAAHDQTFCPLHIDDLIQGIIELQNHNQRGIFNIGGPEIWTRYHLALNVAYTFGVSTGLVQKISLGDLNEFFQRPRSTTLCSEKMYSITQLIPKKIKTSIEMIRDNYT